MGLADGEAWEKEHGVPAIKFPIQKTSDLTGIRPAQQPWVARLSVMMQSVLFAAVRAPDGIKKNHPVKVLMRWYRRSVLVSAFDGKALSDPFVLGGGSFTGPFTAEHVSEYCITNDQSYRQVSDWWVYRASDLDKWHHMNQMRKVYLNHVDELPHHFQLHLMHAAQIVGYYHPDERIRSWWAEFYNMIVNDAHLFPESKEQLDKRLGDSEEHWREREEVIAK